MTRMPTLDVLERHLRQLVPSAQYQPHSESNILIYVSNGMFIGFSIAEDDLSSSYDAAYQSFKALFSQREGASLEPSFVLCVDAKLDDIEKRSSSIETDVYFCRKYVLPFSGSVQNMLAQLPFLPLDVIESIDARPETAQTFLRMNGVSTELAKHIAVPAQRSAEKIVDLCLEGHYGDLESNQAHPDREPANGASRVSADSIKVESIEIEGFRAYKKKVKFNLGERVTFLYGPNGFGKTSFFDAFDFALTGGIGRLETEIRGMDLQILASHLDAPPESSGVSMAVHLGEQRVVIDRRVSDAKSPQIDGAKTDRKSLLGKITGAMTPSADRIENLVNLFRATHLFSQEQQELTKNMQAKSELSSDIVSRMLALDDYASSATKLSAVIAEIEARQRKLGARAEQAEERAAEARRIISELSAKIGDGAKVDIEALIAPLIQEAASFGVVISDQPSHVATLRALRASLEFLLAQLQSKEGNLASLRSRALSRNELMDRADLLRTESTNQSQRLVTIEDERINAEAAAIACRESLTISLALEGRISEERSRIAWSLANSGPYQELLGLAREIEESLPELSAKVQTSAKAAQDCQALLSFSESMLQSKRAEVFSAEQQYTSAKSLFDQMGDYIALTHARNLQRKTSSQLYIVAGELASAIASAERSAEEARNAVSELAERIKIQEGTHEELRTIIDQLRGHLHGSECPLCGHDHGTKSALIQKLERYDSLDPHAELREALRSAREVEQERGSHLAKLKEQLQENSTASREATTLLQLSEAAIDVLEALCAENGIVASDEQELVSSVMAFVDGCAEGLPNLRAQLDLAEESVKEQRNQAARANEILLKLRAEHRSSDTRLAEIKRDAAEIEQDARFTASNLLASNEALHTRASTLSEEHAAASENLHLGREALQTIEANLKRINDQRKTSSEVLTQLADQLVATEKTIDAIDVDLEKEGLTPADPVSAIDSLLNDVSNHRALARTLVEKVTSAELAADAATTAAAMGAHRATLEEQTQARDTAANQVRMYAPWLSFFEEINEKITKQRNEAVSNFTTRYGPRTSVIQKRLRAVYGFEDVSIVPSDSRISVSVSRHGKKLRPTDYFSQSQQQTLLLGLFLTACSSQTWSHFGPVLLDDPVAHFDDLNTYAFLDLIRGLLLDDGRQFVISTCDERFMQMAIRKFKTLGDGARFYRFQSIGAEGPEIVEI